MPLEYQYITKPDERDKAVEALLTTNVIGVDIEGDSLYHYNERVSLIQISGGERNYIFDPLLLDSVLELAPLFENRSILKIFHGSEYDTTSLKRDYHFTIGPIFDTALAARAIGVPRWSLKELVFRFFGVTLCKTHQKSNWSLRPLSQEQLDYACEDTLYLPPLYTLLSEEIAKKGRMDHITEECRLLENLTWTRRPFDPDDYLRIQGASLLPPETQKILRALVIARDGLARERDLPPYRVAHSSDLLKLADHHPENEEAFMKCFRKESLLRDVSVWLDTIQRSLSAEIPVRKRDKKKNPPLTYGQQKLLARLKAWRDQQSRVEEVDAAMIITTPVLKEIARTKPRTLKTLETVSGLRNWQISHYGAHLVNLVLFEPTLHEGDEAGQAAS